MKNSTNPTALANLTKKDGYISIFVALVILNIVTLIILGTLDALKNYTERKTNSEHNEKALRATQTGVNIGKHLASKLAPGINVPLHYFCNDGDGSPGTVGLDAPPNNSLCTKFVSTYEVTSLAGIVNGSDNSPSATDDRYIVPPPGEGNAGENCIRPNNFNNPLHLVDQNILKPCNWNKLYYGKAVAIPLYKSVPLSAWNLDGTINPVDLPNGPPGFGDGLDSFTIKVRTPCAGGHDYDNGNLAGPDEDDWCLDEAPSSVTGPDARPDLDDQSPSSTIDPTDIIVHWQIISQCNYEPSPGNPSADDNYDGECIAMAVTPPTDGNKSDINKEAINYAKEFYNYAVVGTLADVPRREIDDLNVGGSSHPTIVNYLKNIFTSAQRPPGTTSVVINRPVLYLSAVSPITTYINTADPELNEYVPYIEYQIETDQPISDSNFTIRATGRFGNHSSSEKAKRAIFNAFPSYVFQN